MPLRAALTFLLLFGAGCVGTRSGVPSPGADGAARGAATRGDAAGEVVQAAQRLFDAMAARDTTALRALLHPAARVVGVSPDGDVRAQGAAEWVRGVGRAREALRERIWTPHVEVGGALATLWAPYDFHVGGRFSHCGTDAFQFVREEGTWRLLTVSFTVETEGCRPAPGPRP